MLERVAEFNAGQLDLAKLVSDLRGLFVEADPHDPRVRSEFEALWSPIDGEHELRTEAWAPPGLASDANLERSLQAFRGWVNGVLVDDSTDNHS